MIGQRLIISGLLALFLVQGIWMGNNSVLQAKTLPRLSVSEPATLGSNGNIRVITAKVLVNAPASWVWRTMTNYSQLKSILPGYQKSDILLNSGTLKTLDLAMRVNPLLPLYHYQARVQENRDNLQISLERVSGDFKHLKATYQLIPQSEQQTLLVYKLAIDPGSSIPGTNGILKANTEKSCLALQRYLEESNRKSMIGQR